MNNKFRHFEAFGKRRGRRILPSVIAVTALSVPIGVADAQAGPSSVGTGAVFGMTNGILGNSVSAFSRNAKGRLKPAGSFSTGGTGSGVLENNATSLILGEGNQQSPTDLGGGDRFLFAANTGSNSITVFERTGARLRRVEVEQAQQGNINHPISLTLHSNVLYVLNGATTNCTAGNPTVSGFTVSTAGRLTPIAGSTQPVPGGLLSGCAQVSFDQTGKRLVVSERQTDNLATYRVDGAGRAGPPRSNATTEIGPFGLNFTNDNVLLSAVNNLALPLQGGAASYAINADDSLTPLSATAERNGRSDTCWIEITDDGRYVYTASFQSGDISSYIVETDGRLALLNPVAARVNAPLPGAFDLALVDSDFLYGLDTNLGTVVAFRIDSAGGLTEIDRENLGSLPLGLGSLGSLPGAFGLAAT